MASSILLLWASVFFREKLPISEAGTAETGSYGTAAKCIQTQKPVVVSNETFNMASQFQCVCVCGGGGECLV